jgi:hypothetical protein
MNKVAKAEGLTLQESSCSLGLQGRPRPSGAFYSREITHYRSPERRESGHDGWQDHDSRDAMGIAVFGDKPLMAQTKNFDANFPKAADYIECMLWEQSGAVIVQVWLSFVAALGTGRRAREHPRLSSVKQRRMVITGREQA